MHFRQYAFNETRKQTITRTIQFEILPSGPWRQMNVCHMKLGEVWQAWSISCRKIRLYIICYALQPLESLHAVWSKEAFQKSLLNTSLPASEPASITCSQCPMWRSGCDPQQHYSYICNTTWTSLNTFHCENRPNITVVATAERCKNFHFNQGSITIEQYIELAEHFLMHQSLADTGLQVVTNHWKIKLLLYVYRRGKCGSMIGYCNNNRACCRPFIRYCMSTYSAWRRRGRLVRVGL